MSIRQKTVGIIETLVIAVGFIPTSIALVDEIRNRQWHLQSLNIQSAHSISTGLGVVVAVIDTGTYPHPDLRRNLLPGTDRTSDGKIDGKSDEDGHGTGIAALIAAHGRSGRSGVQGIAPSAKILPVKVSNTGLNIESSIIGEGVKWATSNGARVINVSISAGPAFGLQDGVNAALQKDVVVVAGAGNTTSGGAIMGYPAAMEGVLAVGATGRNGKHASLSIKDARIKICAPGVDITSARPTTQYGTANGTSDSTAIVSGAAALVRARFPQLSSREVIHRLTATADDIGPPGLDDECGFGRLNVAKALAFDVPPLVDDTARASGPTQNTPSLPSAATPESRDAAAPGDQPAGSGAPLVLGGLAGLVLAGAMVAVLAIRRRRAR